MTKEFGGEIYHRLGSATLKKNATHVATNARSKGYNARVVLEDGRYVVYARKKEYSVLRK